MIREMNNRTGNRYRLDLRLSHGKLSMFRNDRFRFRLSTIRSIQRHFSLIPELIFSPKIGRGCSKIILDIRGQGSLY